MNDYEIGGQPPRDTRGTAAAAGEANDAETPMPWLPPPTNSATAPLRGQRHEDWLRERFTPDQIAEIEAEGMKLVAQIKAKKRGRASVSLEPMPSVPAPSSHSDSDGGHCSGDTQVEIAAVGPRGRASCSPTPKEDVSAPSDTIAVLRALQVRRVAAQRTVLRQDNATGAYVRREMGWSPDLPEKDAARIKKAAAKLIAAIGDGAAPADLVAIAPQDVIDSVALFVAASHEARKPFDALLKTIERDMERAAKTLPVWGWAAEVRGLGPKSLAAIVGEAGDIGSYTNPGKLWKRMGLAVIGGKRQGAPGAGASAEDWIAHGYKGRRRSVMWNVGVALLKAQVRADKDDDGERLGTSRAIGPYGALYLEHKAYQLARGDDITPKRAHDRAQRYVEKRLLRELWRAWRGATGELTPSERLPPAELPEAA